MEWGLTSWKEFMAGLRKRFGTDEGGASNHDKTTRSEAEKPRDGNAALDSPNGRATATGIHGSATAAVGSPTSGSHGNVTAAAASPATGSPDAQLTTANGPGGPTADTDDDDDTLVKNFRSKIFKPSSNYVDPFCSEAYYGASSETYGSMVMGMIDDYIAYFRFVLSYSLCLWGGLRGKFFEHLVWTWAEVSKWKTIGRMAEFEWVTARSW